MITYMSLDVFLIQPDSTLVSMVTGRVIMGKTVSPLFLVFIPPAKHSFRGVYCFQSVRDSKIPRFRDSVIPSSVFEGFAL